MIEHAEIFDSEEVKKYEKNIWSSRYKLGLYFSALHEKNIELYIYIKIKSKHEEKWYKTLHSLHDGLSALRTLNSEKNLSLNIPEFSIRKSTSFIFPLINALRSGPSTKNSYKLQKPYHPGTEFDHFTLEIPELKTFNILNITAKTCMRLYSESHTSRWMIPARTGNEKGLQASYLGIEVNENDSMEKTKEALKDKLKSGEHWGNYFLAQLGLLFGRSSIRLGTKKTLSSKSSLWMGSVSNLGDLGYGEKVEGITVLAPVRWHRPIGAVLYKFNGQQVLTLTIHDSLPKETNYLLKSEIEKKIREL